MLALAADFVKVKVFEVPVMAIVCEVTLLIEVAMVSVFDVVLELSNTPSPA
jgi:hypothetical protein